MESKDYRVLRFMDAKRRYNEIGKALWENKEGDILQTLDLLNEAQQSYNELNCWKIEIAAVLFIMAAKCSQEFRDNYFKEYGQKAREEQSSLSFLWEKMYEQVTGCTFYGRNGDGEEIVAQAIDVVMRTYSPICYKNETLFDYQFEELKHWLPAIKHMENYVKKALVEGTQENEELVSLLRENGVLKEFPTVDLEKQVELLNAKFNGLVMTTSSTQKVGKKDNRLWKKTVVSRMLGIEDGSLQMLGNTLQMAEDWIGNDKYSVCQLLDSTSQKIKNFVMEEWAVEFANSSVLKINLRSLAKEKSDNLKKRKEVQIWELAWQEFDKGNYKVKTFDSFKLDDTKKISGAFPEEIKKKSLVRKK